MNFNGLFARANRGSMEFTEGYSPQVVSRPENESAGYWLNSITVNDGTLLL